MASNERTHGALTPPTGGATSTDVPASAETDQEKNLVQGKSATQQTKKTTTQSPTQRDSFSAAARPGTASLKRPLLMHDNRNVSMRGAPAPSGTNDTSTNATEMAASDSKNGGKHDRASGQLENSENKTTVSSTPGAYVSRGGALSSTQPPETQTRPESQSGNSGNDRVTVDTPNRPLSQTILPVMSVGSEVQVRSVQKAPPAPTTMGTAAGKPARASLSYISGSEPRNLATTKVPEARAQGQQQQQPWRHAPDTKTAMNIPSSVIAQGGRTSQGSTPSKAKATFVSPVAQTPTPHLTRASQSQLPGEISSATGPADGLIVQDEMSQQEIELHKQRAPLADLYAPFIIGSDTSLAEARQRLHTALRQTRQLRAAFTERVYGKYRVCLRPPPPTEKIIHDIEADPVSVGKSLQEQIHAVKEEKEIEKKEAQKLTAELHAVTSRSGNNAVSFVNADNADQLMYTSAGLSLVILPEHDPEAEGIDMSIYPERAPFNPQSGQRVRAISSAAATAGEVILDRARKGAAMKAERQRQIQLNAGVDSEKSPECEYSRLSVLSSTGQSVGVKPSGTSSVSTIASASLPGAPGPSSGLAPTLRGSKRQLTVNSPLALPAAVAGNRPLRSRVQANMSINTLLSLHPSAEELRSDGKQSAATLALIERGGSGPNTNGHIMKSSLPRLEHPFPESLAARQPNKTNALLPSLPNAGFQATTSIRSKKRLAPRAITAISHVVDQFPSFVDANDANQSATHRLRNSKRRKTSKLGFLLGLQRSAASSKLSKQGLQGDGKGDQPHQPDLHPMLATLVLRAVGLVRPSDVPNTVSPDGQDSVLDPPVIDGTKEEDDVKRVNKVRVEIVENRSFFTDQLRVARPDAASVKRTGTNPMRKERTTESKLGAVANALASPTAAEIRGGGEVLMNSSESSKSSKGQSPKQPHHHRQSSAAGPASNIPQQGRQVDQRNNPQLQQEIQQPRGSGQIHVPSVGMNVAAAAPKNSDFSAQRLLWEDPAALLNQRLNGHVAPYNLAHPQHQISMTGYPNGQGMLTVAGPTSSIDHNPQPAAHQLCHVASSASQLPQGQHSAGDLAEYIGGLHRAAQPHVGYDWPAVGTAAANLASGHTTLAALGLSQHRGPPILDYSSQDRAARALMAREQQTAVVAAAAHAAVAAHHQNMNSQRAAAFLTGTASHTFGQPSTHFPQISNGPSQSSRTTTESPSAMVARHLIHNKPSPLPTPVRSISAPTTATAKSGEVKQFGTNQLSGVEQQASNLQQESQKPVGDMDGKTSMANQENRKREYSGQESGPPEKRHANEKRRDSNPRQGVIAVRKPEPGAEKSNQLGDSSTLRSGQQSPNQTSMVNSRPAVNLAQKTGNQTFVPYRTTSGQPTVARANDAHARRSVLKFAAPPAPLAIPAQVAEMVLDARFHDAVKEFGGNSAPTAALSKLVEYLVSVGAAVPIPKGLVMSYLKDRLNLPGLKNAPSVSTVPNFREVAAASILLYLWKHHERRFQDAFSRSGRIDVDSQCKWLVQSAASICISALTVEICEWLAKDNSAVVALANSIRSKSPQAKTQDSSQALPAAAHPQHTKLAILSGSVASKVLIKGFALENKMDFILPSFSNAVKYLDACRMGALRSKLRERVLLATFMSRRATMSLPFSNAYVSSMVRAGLAVGHDELFETVQNEEVLASTMVPYDIFIDEYGAWEDPCRPPDGYFPGVTGEDLMRRAHARAMIHKSLKKLQDRHGVLGGTSNIGAYADTTPSSGSISEPNRRSSSGGHSTPKSSLKRQRSSISEPPVVAGTGSAQATSWALYESNHHSAPLIWRTDDIENGPYGRHNALTRCRSLSVAMASKGRFASYGSQEDYILPESESGDRQVLRSTQEISWGDVSSMFAPVEIPKPSVKSQKRHDHDTTSHAVTSGVIFAPFVRQIGTHLDDDNDEDSDASSQEEDISDEAMLKEHQAVLDRMKQKLSVVLEARKNEQEQRKKN